MWEVCSLAHSLARSFTNSSAHSWACRWVQFQIAGTHVHTREGRSGVGSWRSDNNTRGAHIAVRALYSRCSVHICVYASVLKSRTALRPFVRSRVARINRSLSSRFLPLPSIAHSDRIFVTFQKKGGKQGGVSHAMDEITSTRCTHAFR